MGDEDIEIIGGVDAFVLMQADDGTAIGEVCQKTGIELAVKTTKGSRPTVRSATSRQSTRNAELCALG